MSGKHERGQLILMISLFLTFLFVLVALYPGKEDMERIPFAGKKAQFTSAFYIAEAGLEVTRKSICSTLPCTVTIQVQAIPWTSGGASPVLGTATVTETFTPPTVTVQSVGKTSNGTASRILSAQINPSNGAILSWRDSYNP